MGTILSKRDLPWLNRDVLRISRKCNLLYRRAKRTGKSRHINKYKLARNMSLKMLHNAKQSFFARLEKCKSKAILENNEASVQAKEHALSLFCPTME